MTINDKYELAAQITLLGFDGYKGRLSAAQQRLIFGTYLLGKKHVEIDCSGQGMITISYSARITSDTVMCGKDFDSIVRSIQTGYISF